MAALPSTVRLGKILESYFSDKGWKYRAATADSQFYVLDFNGKHSSWKTYAFFNEELELISVASVLPVVPPPAKRSTLCELICRIKHVLPICYVDLDVENGMISVRCDIV